MTGRLLSRLLEGVLGFAGGLQATRMGLSPSPGPSLPRSSFPQLSWLRQTEVALLTPGTSHLR